MAGGGGVPAPQKGLVFDGIVTAVISNTEFIASRLAGFGNAFFQGWAAYVIRKADGTGTPPQGESPAVLAYSSANGQFTLAAPYTVPLSVGDELYLLHPAFLAIGLTLVAIPNVNSGGGPTPLLAGALGVAVIADDGTAPPYALLAATTAGIGAPATGWQTIIAFEQNGTIAVNGIALNLEWQSQFIVGAGVGTDTNSWVEISGDGGVTWVPVTDVFTHANAALTTRVRIGIGQWLPGITSNAILVRLQHYVGGADAISQSAVQMRSNSTISINYRKS